MCFTVNQSVFKVSFKVWESEESLTNTHKDSGCICQLLAHAFQAVLNWEGWLVLFFRAGVERQAQSDAHSGAGWLGFKAADISPSKVSACNRWLIFSCKTQGFQLNLGFVWTKSLGTLHTHTQDRSSHLHFRGAPGIKQDGFDLADLSNVSMKAWAAVAHKHTQGVGCPLRICDTA